MNYNTDKEDKWYLWQGQKPPEHMPHITEEQREELAEKVANKHVCNWMQRGNYIVCEIDGMKHGKNIGVHQMLDKEATDQAGKPVIKKFGPVLRK